jgi:hypothetical protein
MDPSADLSPLPVKSRRARAGMKGLCYNAHNIMKYQPLFANDNNNNNDNDPRVVGRSFAG